MSDILFVNACARKESRTHELAQTLLDRMSGQVSELNLYNESIKPLDLKALKKREAATACGDFSADDFFYARQFAAADIIVIAAPYWDLSFPAILKIYLEAISVVGITFSYGADGVPVGLCRAKKLYYITTAGGKIENFNFGFDYVKALAENLYKIQEVLLFKAENLDIHGADVKKITDDSKAEIRKIKDA